MKIIDQSWEFEEAVNGIDILLKIERAGRTCYKSTEGGNTKTFIKSLIVNGHHSVLEHANITVRIITDRGVTHEIVRHRLAAYSQESTRYCNYSNDRFGNEITVILPVWLYEEHKKACEGELTVLSPYWKWYRAMSQAETYYFSLLSDGWKPQQARDVLPNSLKTEIVMTCNIREWRHFFTLRCAPAAHPQMRELALSMLGGFSVAVPVLFDDITEKFFGRGGDNMERYWKHDLFSNTIKARLGISKEVVSTITVDELKNLIDTDFEGFGDRPKEIEELKEIYKVLEFKPLKPSETDGIPEGEETVRLPILTADYAGGEIDTSGLDEFLEEHDNKEEVESVEKPLT